MSGGQVSAFVRRFATRVPAVVLRSLRDDDDDETDENDNADASEGQSGPVLKSATEAEMDGADASATAADTNDDDDFNAELLAEDVGSDDRAVADVSAAHSSSSTRFDSAEAREEQLACSELGAVTAADADEKDDESASSASSNGGAKTAAAKNASVRVVLGAGTDLSPLSLHSHTRLSEDESTLHE